MPCNGTPCCNKSFPPRSPVRDGQTSPHKPRLVVSHSTCPPPSPSPLANSFIIGTAVTINNRVSTTGGLQVPDAGAGGSERGRFIKEFSIGALLRNSPGGVGQRRTCADCGTLVRIKEKYTELGELKDEYVCIMFAFFGTRRVCASFSSIEGNDLGFRVYRDNAEFGA